VVKMTVNGSSLRIRRVVLSCIAITSQCHPIRNTCCSRI
jgi:hypothetical protein